MQMQASCIHSCPLKLRLTKISAPWWLFSCLYPPRGWGCQEGMCWRAEPSMCDRRWAMHKDSFSVRKGVIGIEIKGRKYQNFIWREKEREREREREREIARARGGRAIHASMPFSLENWAFFAIRCSTGSPRSSDNNLYPPPQEQ